MEAAEQFEELPEESLSAEENAVAHWRYSQLRSLGFGRLEARLLTECGCDLGLVRRLVAGGCTPQLAARIVL